MGESVSISQRFESDKGPAGYKTDSGIRMREECARRESILRETLIFFHVGRDLLSVFQ